MNFAKKYPIPNLDIVVELLKSVACQNKVVKMVIIQGEGVSSNGNDIQVLAAARASA
jgi:hypothetical protein